MVVMKFGGTSVGSAAAIRRVGDIVRSRLEPRPIVVVSAVSGVTDKLIGAARGAQRRDRTPEASMEELTRIHRAILAELELPADLVDGALKRLAEVLKGIFFLRELTARSLDYVMTFGEVMSSQIVAAHLERTGIAARAWSGWDIGIVTDDAHGEAAVLRDTYTNIPKLLGPHVAEAVPVVTGFIARTAQGERSTLGRGGSDYSAAIVGRALGVSEIQIWTDVSGILSADPRVVSDAFTLRQVTFAEAAELAYFGAKVLHPKTIEPAVEANIPVRILNTFRPEDPGTIVVRRAEKPSERLIEGIALKKGLTLVNVTSTRMLDTLGYMASIFDTLRRHDVSVDCIATSEVSVTLVVDKRHEATLPRVVHDLESFAVVRVTPGRAIVAVVGEGMHLQPGMSGRIFSTLGRAGVNVELISQGSSELNVTFVVKDSDAENAMRSLHAEFLRPAG